jgi:hypothetical protein
MATQQFPIERNGPKRIEISWTGVWKDFTVKFDGATVGTATKEEISAGKELTLPDGSTFKVQLRPGSAVLAVLRNGAPLPGSGTDPVQVVTTTASLIFFIAGFSAFVGFLGWILQVEFFQSRGFGLGSVISGAILAVLGFFTLKQSRVALILAMVILAADGVASTVMLTQSGHNPPVAGLIVRIFFLTAMWRGYKAMGELNATAR